MVLITKTLASLETKYQDNFRYFHLQAQIIKCEIYYQIQTYLLDGLHNLNLILPEVLSSNS